MPDLVEHEGGEASALSTYLSGAVLSLTLIVALGAQNAFVLRQGLRREHVFLVCMTCALSDALLIALGVVGFGAVSDAVPWLERVMRWAGAAFLVWYGALSLWRARKEGEGLEASGRETASRAETLATVLALTWLNPHVYLDTVVLLGSVASQSDDRVVYAAGAMTISFVFFFGLGYGARALGPVFARPGAWRVLDALIGLFMWVIAWTLMCGGGRGATRSRAVEPGGGVSSGVWRRVWHRRLRLPRASGWWGAGPPRARAVTSCAPSPPRCSGLCP